MTPKPQVIKDWHIGLFITFENFCFPKDTITKVKGQLKDIDKIFANHAFVKALVWGIYKEHFSSFQLFSCVWLCNMDRSTPGFPVHHQLLELAQTHVHRVGDAIQPSHPVIPFSSRLQSFPALGSFLTSHLLASSGQSIGASAPASVLPVNVQAWFPLALTDILDYIQFNFFLWLTFVLCILFLEVHCRDVSFWR